VTQENLNYTLIGRTNPPLHPYGMLQAQAVADALGTIGLDALVASPLQRSLDTARAIAAKHKKLEITTMDDLTEIDLGILDGMSAFTAYDQYRDIMDQALDVTLPDFRFPQGESRRETLVRFQAAIDTLVSLYPDGNVCVVTHGGPLGLWLAHLHGDCIARFRYWQPAHGSITRVIRDNQHYRLASHNKTQHLPKALQELVEQARQRLP
jgi:broad specificity phosphatase PhoE